MLSDAEEDVDDETRYKLLGSWHAGSSILEYLDALVPRVHS